MAEKEYELRAPSAFGTSPKSDSTTVGFGGGRAADKSEEESAVDEMVDGKYVVEVKKDAMVGVKVTDMLGEEVLVVKEV